MTESQLHLATYYYLLWNAVGEATTIGEIVQYGDALDNPELETSLDMLLGTEGTDELMNNICVD
jgi:hypothetical protein